MKALNLSIYTGNDDTGHKVTMTAEFENHEDAVRFHEGIAKLCRDVSHPAKSLVPSRWPRLQNMVAGDN